MGTDDGGSRRHQCSLKQWMMAFVCCAVAFITYTKGTNYMLLLQQGLIEAGASTAAASSGSSSSTGGGGAAVSGGGATSESSAASGASSSSTPLSNHPNVHERIRFFRDTALKFDPVSDKVGVTSEHRYHNMYGTFLLPLVTHKPTLKFLEIGLGCNMGYGPGASIKIWKDLMPKAELWEAEYVKECVDKAQKAGQLEGIHTLVGDQADNKVLDGWIETSGGNFDVVIDDGGHHNCQISNSFDKLWPQVLPGGLYFIEDMHVGRVGKYIGEECGSVIMSEKLNEWSNQLIYKTFPANYQYKYKLPKDLIFIHCQVEACVLGKRSGQVNDPQSPVRRGEKKEGK